MAENKEEIVLSSGDEEDRQDCTVVGGRSLGTSVKLDDGKLSRWDLFAAW